MNRSDVVNVKVVMTKALSVVLTSFLLLLVASCGTSAAEGPSGAKLDGGYLLGTWEIVGKSWHSISPIPAIQKSDEEQIGKKVTFTQHEIQMDPLFLSALSPIHCLSKPLYTMKKIDLYSGQGNKPEQGGEVVSRRWLQWWGLSAPYQPYEANYAIVFHADCDDNIQRRDNIFTAQLTRSGDLAVPGDGGFFLLKKISMGKGDGR